MIADWKHDRGRRTAYSYQVPSLVVCIIPSQALGPNSSTTPKSIPPARDDIQIQEPMGHFPFYIAGQLRGFFFSFLRKKIKVRGDRLSLEVRANIRGTLNKHQMFFRAPLSGKNKMLGEGMCE